MVRLYGGYAIFRFGLLFLKKREKLYGGYSISSFGLRFREKLTCDKICGTIIHFS